MASILKCESCGGDKIQTLGNGVYKCMYCGKIIVEEKKESAPPTVPPVQYIQQPVIVKNEIEGQKQLPKDSGMGCFGCLSEIFEFIWGIIIWIIIIVALIIKCS